VGHAVHVMREKAIRRIPVVDGSQVVGVLTLGDIAVERDSRTALADISAAPPIHERQVIPGTFCLLGRPSGCDRRNTGPHDGIRPGMPVASPG